MNRLSKMRFNLGNGVQSSQLFTSLFGVLENVLLLKKEPTLNLVGITIFYDFEKPEIDEDDEEVASFLKKVWDAYGKFSAYQLSRATHKKGTPWYKANLEKSSVIENEWIQEYYRKMKS